MSKKAVGYSEPDFNTEYAKYYDEVIGALPQEVSNALYVSPLTPGCLPDIGEANVLAQNGYSAYENGYTLESDGSIRVAVCTKMPGVSPKMWDWWFGWHGCADNRYKIWHPKAHISAQWQDGLQDEYYVGRSSIIEEWIGSELTTGAIQFKSPLEFGFKVADIADADLAVYICARIGHPSLPLDYGYLVHQVRATADGAEMRSRFWLGGQYISMRKEGKVADLVSNFLRKMKTLPRQFAEDLLRHCSEEMTHLAKFLPSLYKQYHADNNPTISDRLNVQCSVIKNTDSEFESVIMGSMFNKINPPARPLKIVEAKTVLDIIETIKYAKRIGKKITVCSGGHSWSANHLRSDSILIMMKHFNAYHIDAHTMTATAGPGVGGSLLMKELYKRDLFFPAGHCKGVCIGGYLLQGGYGWNGRKTGIACQSVIGMDIVTADGTYIHASETENADMFWAARGSGGGFFGVVVNFHLKLFPLPKYRALIAHEFYIKHLEDVYNWAYEVGPAIPKAVEFQMIMSNKLLNILGPGIEAMAPIFADTKEEYEEAMSFMKNSPIKHKAIIATPAIDPGIELLYKGVMSHYPENHFWGVDNMWTHAPIHELMPFLKEIAATMPPAPSHFLWLNWHPGSIEADMAYSNEDNIYLALYANWANANDTAKYENWAPNIMSKMAHLSTGIQLADEGLHKRSFKFLSAENMKKLQAIRKVRDPHGLFHEWHSFPSTE